MFTTPIKQGLQHTQQHCKTSAGGFYPENFHKKQHNKHFQHIFTIADTRTKNIVGIVYFIRAITQCELLSMDKMASNRNKRPNPRQKSNKRPVLQSLRNVRTFNIFGIFKVSNCSCKLNYPVISSSGKIKSRNRSF